MWICNNCGCQNEDDAPSCVNCGMEFDPSVSEYDDAPVEEAEQADYADDAYPEDDNFVAPDTYAEEEPPVQEPEKPVRTGKKKKKSKFKRFMRKLVRRLRAFGHNVAELPSRTLLILGGSVAAILVLIILLVVLIPKKSSTEPAATPTPEVEIEATEEPEATPEPTATPAPTAHPMENLGLEDGRTYLKSGDKADVVAEIQQRLIDLGYMDTPEGGVTTTYGKATKAAVRKFQCINGLTVDGCVGVTTYDAIFADTAKPYVLSGAYDSNIFEDDIIELQDRLKELGYLVSNDPSNGKFDDATVQAVKDFQTKNGLTSDGVAGTETLNVLFSDSAVKAS